MLVCNVVGARPNFMKMAPVVHELRRRSLPQLLVHTGQHYDAAMSQVFFEELGMPEPDVYLGVGSGSHAQQTARVLEAMESICLERRPTLVVVAGDVNSTLAAALAAAKLGLPVAHLEAGLRSRDRSMPEEINRILTDHLSDLLFTTEEDGNRNLRREGISETKICFTGNCMVDSLRRHQDAALARRPWESYRLPPGEYALLTLHRPSNVDSQEQLTRSLDTAAWIAGRMPVLFPVHPRTRQRIEALAPALPDTLCFCDPLPYLSFLGLMARARFVLTDSGGIQEETTALGVPCLTLRRNTERPATIELGTNLLVGDDQNQIRQAVDQICRGEWKQGQIPPLWDGRAAERVVDAIASFSGASRPT